MPRYVLVAKFDHVADIKTLRDEDDKLSVTTTVLNAENENKEVAIDLSETSDIVASTILSWHDTFQIQSKDSSGSSSWIDISYGQTFSNTKKGQTVQTTTDAPRDGFLIKLESTKTTKLQQKFNSSSTWTVVHSKEYNKGSAQLIPTLKAKVTLKDASINLDFTDSFSQVIYYSSNSTGGSWTLIGPDSYGTGSYLTTVQGTDSYVISQQKSRDLTMAYTALRSVSGVTSTDVAAKAVSQNTLAPKAGSQKELAPGYSGITQRAAADKGNAGGSDSTSGMKKYEASVGPVKLVLYVDTKNWGAYVSAVVLGHSFGTLGGNLSNGITYHVDLLAFSGTIKLYLLTSKQSGKTKDIMAEVKLDVFGSSKVNKTETIVSI